eukprot:4664758-Prymnesium_polylepis.1
MQQVQLEQQDELLDGLSSVVGRLKDQGNQMNQEVRAAERRGPRSRAGEGRTPSVAGAERGGTGADGSGAMGEQRGGGSSGGVDGSGCSLGEGAARGPARDRGGHRRTRSVWCSPLCQSACVAACAQLEAQKTMLSTLEEQVEGAGAMMGRLKGKMAEMAKSSDRGKFCAILVLSVIL